MSYHAEVRAFSHGDGHWADWWRVGFLLEEGWLEKKEKVGITVRKKLLLQFIYSMESLCVMFAQERLWLPWQPVAALPTPSAWPDSDSLHLTA